MSFPRAVARRGSCAALVGVVVLSLGAGACGSDDVDSNTSTTTTTASTSVPVSAASTTTLPAGTAAAPSTTSLTPTTVARPPQQPSGGFVNVHVMSLSGTTTTDRGQSVCTTSPGATCDIRFTNDSGTHSLGAKAADAEGHVVWSWTPASVGLTVGQWKIEAVATSGTFTASAIDPLGLQVNP